MNLFSQPDHSSALSPKCDLSGTFFFDFTVILPYLYRLSRLLEFGGSYFDIESFPEGEMQRALQRVIKKSTGKGIKRVSSGADGTDDKRTKKKRKKN